MRNDKCNRWTLVLEIIGASILLGGLWWLLIIL
jgi:hypothetical protein